MERGIIYKSKLFHKFSFAALILVVPFFILYLYLLFLSFESFLDIPYKGENIHWENILGTANSGVLEFVMFAFIIIVFIFFIFIFPILILRNPLKIELFDKVLSIKHPFTFERKKYRLEDIRGYSISYIVTRMSIWGILKFYGKTGNFIVGSTQVDNLKKLMQAFHVSGIHSLGYEPQRFSWSWKKFGQLRFLYDEEKYNYIPDDRKFYDDFVLKRPKTPYFTLALVVFFFYGLLLAFPLFDMRHRYVEYHLDQFPAETVGSFYKCTVVKTKRGIPTNRRKAYYEFTVEGIKYTDYKFLKKGCPPKGSKVAILYSSKNPSISKFIKPIRNKSIKKPSHN